MVSVDALSNSISSNDFTFTTLSSTTPISTTTSGTTGTTTSSGGIGSGGYFSPITVYIPPLASTTGGLTIASTTLSTEDEQILYLLALIESLQKEIADFISNTAKAITSSTFTRNLYMGIKGEDVKKLQIFLNGKGFTVSIKGIGSPGNEGTYFGQQTKNAVKKFQTSKKITPVDGYFGPKTRARVDK